MDALEAICRDESLRNLVASASDVERAWKSCEIPHYRNISPAEHAHLVGRVISSLNGPWFHSRQDWFAQQLAYC